MDGSMKRKQTLSEAIVAEAIVTEAIVAEALRKGMYNW